MGGKDLRPRHLGLSPLAQISNTKNEAERSTLCFIGSADY
jgi:hypothetical protein